jgi:hypothetical protein
MAAKKDDRTDRADDTAAERETVVKPLVDETATEPAVPDGAEVLAPSHDTEAMRRRAEPPAPEDDPSIPKRHPGGDSPNESPEIALAPQEVPAHDSNEQLHVAAAKRQNAQATPTQPPQDRHARSKADEQAAPADGEKPGQKPAGQSGDQSSGQSSKAGGKG